MPAPEHDHDHEHDHAREHQVGSESGCDREEISVVGGG